jgi:hypothetical protein
MAADAALAALFESSKLQAQAGNPTTVEGIPYQLCVPGRVDLVTVAACQTPVGGLSPRGPTPLDMYAVNVHIAASESRRLRISAGPEDVEFMTLQADPVVLR